MEHVNMIDVGSAMGIAKVLNKLNDKITELETKNDEYNDAVNKHNELIEKGA